MHTNGPLCCPAGLFLSDIHKRLDCHDQLSEEARTDFDSRSDPISRVSRGGRVVRCLVASSGCVSALHGAAEVLEEARLLNWRSGVVRVDGID